MITALSTLLQGEAEAAQASVPCADAAPNPLACCQCRALLLEMITALSTLLQGEAGAAQASVPCAIAGISLQRVHAVPYFTNDTYVCNLLRARQKQQWRQDRMLLLEQVCSRAKQKQLRHQYHALVLCPNQALCQQIVATVHALKGDNGLPLLSAAF
eukprot:1146337-Pelagomonas_calceolata.AAC.6